MSVTLGRTPEKLKVTVSPGGNFVSAIRRADGTTWADGTSLVLDFGTIEWAAEMTGDTALWSRSGDDVDALLASRPKGVHLWFVDGPTRLLWAAGSLVRSA